MYLSNLCTRMCPPDPVLRSKLSDWYVLEKLPLVNAVTRLYDSEG